MAMKAGTKVLIQGLVNASQHNGKTGRVVEGGAPGPGRVGVKVSDGSGKVLAIKWDNLRACADAGESRANNAPAKAGSPPDYDADGGGVARLEVQRGDGEAWEDAGPIDWVDGMARVAMGRNATPPANKETRRKHLPERARRILGPETSDAYAYRHSPDGVDANLLVLLHGAGDTHRPYDALAGRMELPQTAALSLSASMSLRLNGGVTSTFVELPFGLGYTWFEEMEYATTGEALPADHPRRLRSLSRAVDALDAVIRSLTSTSDDDRDGDGWAPERVFLFGFSAGACLAMELCRTRADAGLAPLGGSMCVCGGIRTEGTLPGHKRGGGDDSSPARRRETRPTDVLIVAGSEDATYSGGDAAASKRMYRPGSVQVYTRKGKGHSMIGGEDEMRVVMEFLSKRLVRRMVSMEGLCKEF